MSQRGKKQSAKSLKWVYIEEEQEGQQAWSRVPQHLTLNEEIRENTGHGSCRALETMAESLGYILSGMRRYCRILNW